jgi:hypothetical protein
MCEGHSFNLHNTSKPNLPRIVSRPGYDLGLFYCRPIHLCVRYYPAPREESASVTTPPPSWVAKPANDCYGWVLMQVDENGTTEV